MQLDDFVGLMTRLYPDSDYPKPIDALVALRDVRSEARGLPDLNRFLRAKVQALLSASEPVLTAFKVDPDVIDDSLRRRSQKGELMLGQLALGVLAEQAFESKYREALGGSEFRLDDHRASRNDTDYRVLNGGGRPLFRINIKLHGTQFRKAQEHVGLSPDDCFPLATYKIWSATQKELQEHLPYLFLVVRTGLTSGSVVQQFPQLAREAVRLIHASPVAVRKREVEEKVVSSVLGDPEFAPMLDRCREDLKHADWFVLSAKRADRLLREKLFERVFAVRQRNFTQAFRNAEIDMHLSMLTDMTPLEQMLEILQREGSQAVVGRAMGAAI